MYIDDNGRLNFESRGEVIELSQFINYYKDFSPSEDFSIDFDKLINELEHLYMIF